MITSFIKVGERRIRLLTAGSGPPMLLIHGIGASADWWQPLAQRLADRWTLYACDLPGSGESDAPTDDEYLAPELFIARLCEALALPDAIVVGHSMGGYVAGRFAATHPQRVTALVLIDAAGFSPVRLLPLRLASLPLLGELAMRLPSLLIPGFVQALAVRHQAISQAMIAAAMKYARTPTFRHVFLKSLRMGIDHTGVWRTLHLGASLAAFQKPLLIIWGDRDPVFPVSGVAHLTATLPAAEFAVIPNCGHVPIVEAPDETARLIIDFLQAPSSRPAQP